MADRVTQLQQKLNDLIECMANAVGLLQQETRSFEPSSDPPTSQLPSSTETKPPPPPSSVEQPPQQPEQDLSQLFAKLIVQTTKQVDILIEALPDSRLNQKLQLETLKNLHVDNLAASSELRSTAVATTTLLASLSATLDLVAGALLDLKRLETNLVESIAKKQATSGDSEEEFLMD